MSQTIVGKAPEDAAYRGIELDPASTGELVKRARQKKGLSVRQLAARLNDGTHFTTISKIEKGRMAPSLQWITKLSEALGVPYLELITGVHTEEAATSLPLYEATDFLKREKQSGWIATNYVGKRAFSLELSSEEPELKTLIRVFFVIDPDDFPPEEGWIYCLSVQAEMKIGVYRIEPPRFVPWRSPKEPEIVVGRTPFEFVGRVVRVIENL